MLSKRHFQLGIVIVVCAVISVIDYWKDGSIPLLTLLYGGTARPPLSRNARRLSRTKSDCECNCTDIAAGMESNDQDFNNEETEVKAGPSKVIEVVPMNTLKDTVNLDKEEGLRYLDHPALNRYYLCKPSKLLLLPNHTPAGKRCRERTFLNQKSPLVALVSFHGSGNTWVRHLVEQATGIFTGSIYCDPGLKAAFPGEFVVSGNVIITKTHQADSVELPEDIKMFTGKSYFDKAIVIVRNPYDALVSEANRRWNSKRSVNDHLGVADETAFISK